MAARKKGKTGDLIISKFACAGNVPFTTCHHERSVTVDLAAGVGFQHRQQTLRRHVRRVLNPSDIEESWSQVHEIHEVADGAAGLDLSGPSDGQSHFCPDVVQVALGPRESGNAVVAADHDDRVVEFANRLQSFEDYAEASIERLALPEVVIEIFPNVVDVGQKLGHTPLQMIGLQSPEVFSTALLPTSMGVGWPPPVAEWGVGWGRIEKRVEVTR